MIDSLIKLIKWLIVWLIEWQESILTKKNLAPPRILHMQKAKSGQTINLKIFIATARLGFSFFFKL